MLRLQPISVTDNANYIYSGGGEAKNKKEDWGHAHVYTGWELEQHYSKTAEAGEPLAYQQEVNYPLSA